MAAANIMKQRRLRMDNGSQDRREGTLSPISRKKEQIVQYQGQDFKVITRPVSQLHSNNKIEGMSVSKSSPDISPRVHYPKALTSKNEHSRNIVDSQSTYDQKASPYEGFNNILAHQISIPTLQSRNLQINRNVSFDSSINRDKSRKSIAMSSLKKIDSLTRQMEN